MSVSLFTRFRYRRTIPLFKFMNPWIHKSRFKIYHSWSMDLCNFQAWIYEWMHNMHPCIQCRPSLMKSCPHASMHPCNYASLHQCIHEFIGPNSHVSIHPCAHMFWHPFAYMHLQAFFINASIHPYTYTFLHPGIHASVLSVAVDPFICAFILLCIHLSFLICIHTFIYMLSQAFIHIELQGKVEFCKIRMPSIFTVTI